MSEKIFTKNFCFAFLSLFCSAMVMYLLLSTITEYATRLGATEFLAGLVSGIYVLGGLLTRLYSGKGMEKHGWRRIAIFFLSLHFLACCCYFFVHTMPLLLLVRFLQGLGFGAGSSAIMTIGMSVLPKSRYGEASGYLMLATTLSIAVGPFLGGRLYDHFGAYGCFAAASLLCALTLLFLLLVDLSEVEQPQAEIQLPAKGLERVVEPKILPLCFCLFLCAFGYVAIMSFYRLYAAEQNLTKEFSYFFLFYAAILCFTRPMAGKIQDRMGDDPICLTGIVAQMLGILILALHPCLPTILLCAIGCALGYGTLSSCCTAIACRSTSPQRRSYALATCWVGCDGGVGIGPAILGAIAAWQNYTVMYLTAACVGGLALPVYYFLWSKKHPHIRKQ